jgi:putative ABC transport system permease protein
MRRDVIYAWRSLMRAKSLVLACVVSLGLGLSATTVLFSVVDAALLKPPPFQRADRIAIIASTQTTPREGETVARWSWPRFVLLRSSIRSTERIAAFASAVLSVTTGDAAEALPLEIVSSDYMSVAGVQPLVGRAFTVDDELAGALPVAILAHDLWTTRFASDSSIVGRPVTVNGVQLAVVGIMPPGFAGLGGQARLWISPAAAQLVSYAEWLTTDQNFISVAGRLRDGTSFDAARRELRELGARIHAERGEFNHPADYRFGATAVPLAHARSDPTTTRALMLLSGAVVLLLVLACANVASLLLGRGDARRREIAIRLAVGATRGLLVRQLLIESALLAVAACGVAIVASTWATQLITIPPTLSRGRNFFAAVGEFATPTFDARVFAFAAAACVMTVGLFGLLPALRATRTDVTSDLKSGATFARRGRRLELRDWVVALQVALAMTLLVGGGTLLASYRRLRLADVGFDPRNLLTFMLRPSEVQYAGNKAPVLLEHVVEEINRVPGVVSTTLDGCAPLTVQCAGARLQIVGREIAPADAPGVRRHYVAPNHFSTLRIPVLRGRALTNDDRAGHPHVVVINAEAARRFWPNEDPIGKRVWFNANATFGSADSSAEIVGIVADVAYRPLDDHPVEADFFTSYKQFTYPSRLMMIRANRDPLSIAKDVAAAVRRVDPNLALFDVMTMEQRAGASWAKRTFETWLLVAFAAIAIVLATVGVYAVTSHAVARRTREFGVRIALGASDARILETAASRTARLASIGVGVGMVAALAGSRVLRSFLYETSPMEPAVVAAVGGVALVVLALATYVPARRALGAKPVEILRSE